MSGLSVIPLSERQGLNQTICKCHNVAYTLCFNLKYGHLVVYTLDSHADGRSLIPGCGLCVNTWYYWVSMFPLICYI